MSAELTRRLSDHWDGELDGLVGAAGLDQFVSDELNAASSGYGANKVLLKARFGEVKFGLLLRYVQAELSLRLVDFPTRAQCKAANDTRMKAIAGGLTFANLSAVRSRAEGIYSRWQEKRMGDGEA